MAGDFLDGLETPVFEGLIITALVEIFAGGGIGIFLTWLENFITSNKVKAAFKAALISEKIGLFF